MGGDRARTPDRRNTRGHHQQDPPVAGTARPEPRVGYVCIGGAQVVALLLAREWSDALPSGRRASVSFTRDTCSFCPREGCPGDVDQSGVHGDRILAPARSREPAKGLH
jgi:hypothetical protein